MFSDNHEWMLNKHSFDEILLRHPGLDFDLFASRLNYQISSYCSWHTYPNSAHVDAFTTNWIWLKFLCFPPFSLHPRCLQKISLRPSTGCTTNRPALANSNVVSSPPTTFMRPALDPAPTTRPSTTPLRQWPTSTAQEPSTDGMSCVRGSFSHYHFPEEVTDILMASWRKGTQKQYATYVKKWMGFYLS